MAPPTRIIGSYLSPCVRKALVVLEVKGIPYQIDPIVPFLGDDRFSQVSPAAECRAALAEMGAPLTAESYGTATPRRGFFADG